MADNLKKTAFVIAFRDFKDREYFVPKAILEKEGFQVLTVSSKAGKAFGADGGEAEVSLEASAFDPRNFSAVLFAGGSGMEEELDNPDFQRIARESFEEGLLVAAICIAPALLAKTGILGGKKATVFSAPMQRKGVDILREAGARYSEEKVVQDGNVITGCGPQAAEDFGRAVVSALSS